MGLHVHRHELRAIQQREPIPGFSGFLEGHGHLREEVLTALPSVGFLNVGSDARAAAEQLSRDDELVIGLQDFEELDEPECELKALLSYCTLGHAVASAVSSAFNSSLLTLNSSLAPRRPRAVRPDGPETSGRLTRCPA